MSYEIFNVPTPEAKPGATNAKKGESKYPFRQLQIGQSFFVPNKETVTNPADLEKAAYLGTLRAHCSRQSRHVLKGREFRAAIMPGNDLWLQVWRSA